MPTPFLEVMSLCKSIWCAEVHAREDEGCVAANGRGAVHWMDARRHIDTPTGTPTEGVGRIVDLIRPKA